VCIGILGQKIGMTQIFDENGLAVPVTIIKAGPCSITQVKTMESDGYNAIQIGYLEKPAKIAKKSEIGHFDKSGSKPFRFTKEYKVENPDEKSLGEKVTVTNFAIGQYLDVSARTIGKGFAGLQKRHNFSRGPMTHGSKNHRLPGSIGAGTTPGRVLPGKKMAGHLGNKITTIKNIEVIGIHEEENLLILKGSIQGKPGNLISLKPSVKV
jgi:large subunit ribosomal protein L3